MMTTPESAIEGCIGYPGAIGAMDESLVPDFMAPERDPEVTGLVEAYRTKLTEITCSEQSYQDVYEREGRFFDKVYAAAMEMSEDHDGKVVLLFDVDQTISEGMTHDRVIRPAFSLVVSALHEILGDRLQVGLLTTLKNYNNAYNACLADIKPDLINPDYLLCTREYAFRPEQAASLASKDDAVRLRSVEHLADPAVAAATRQGALRLGFWYDPDGKLHILDDMLQQTEQEGTRFVFIDNLPSAAALSRDHPRLRGICVADEVQDDFFRSFNQAGYNDVEEARAAYAA